MTRVFISLCSALFLCFVNLSCTAQPKLENTLLWKISGNGLKENSYLLGTDHGVPYSFLDSIKGVYEAFNSAENLVKELTDENISEQKALLLPEGMTLSQLFDKEELHIINSACKKTLGFPDLSNSKMKPIALLYLLILSDDIDTLKASEYMYIDKYLENIGRPRMKIFALDDTTAGSIINLEELPLPVQAQSLLELVKTIDEYKVYQARQREAYLKQDLNELWNLYQSYDSFFIDSNIYEEYEMSDEDNPFVCGRNKLWMKKIPEILKSGSSFIAVGALHLVGENGLIALLRKEGYTVEPVM